MKCKEAVANYYRTNSGLVINYHDVASETGFSAPTVSGACTELYKEGFLSRASAGNWRYDPNFGTTDAARELDIRKEYADPVKANGDITATITFKLTAKGKTYCADKHIDPGAFINDILDYVFTDNSSVRIVSSELHE